MTLFDLNVVMENGWIVTLSSGVASAAQGGIATKGGSGTPVPDILIQVTDVGDVYRRATVPEPTVVHGLIDEP